MKNNWIITSIIAGLIAGIITLLLTGIWQLSLIGTIAVFLIVVVNNPKKRYMKAFWVILSMFLVLNRFYFEIIGDLAGVHFKAGSPEIGDIVSVFLIILAIITLILDYLERNGKIAAPIISVKKNKVGDINGSGNKVDQKND